MNIIVTATCGFGMLACLFLEMESRVFILTVLCLFISFAVTFASIFIKKLYRVSVYSHPILASLIGMYLTVVDGFGFFYYLYGVLGVIIAALYYSSRSVFITANINVVFYLITYIFFKEKIYILNYSFLTFTHVLTYVIALILIELAMYIQCKDGKKLLRMQTARYEVERQWNKNILDNAEQGFLTVDSQSIIEKSASRQCEKLFGSRVAGRTLGEVLFSDDEKEGSFINDLIKQVFLEDSSRKDVFLSLLPEIIQKGMKLIELKYKLIKSYRGNESLMVITTDITEKTEIQKQIKLEQANLKMIINCISERFEVIDIISQFREFVLYIKSNASENNREFSKNNLLREAHNFKGLFSLFEMHNTVRGLEKLESELEQGQEIQEQKLDISALLTCLEKDLYVIREYLGEGFLDEGDMEFKISKWRFNSLKEQVRRVLIPEESHKAISIIESLKYRSIKQLLSPYIQYTTKLAQRINKPIKEIEITGADIYIDYEKHKLIIMSLVHIFRNCVDHGIEDEDERLELNKPPEGEIKCNIADDGKNIHIIIEDDGKGIDFELLRQLIAQRGLLDEIEAKSIDDERLLEYIFNDGFTTRDCVTDISGRGVGLSSVRERVGQLGGRIIVATESGRGTRFDVQFPKAKEFGCSVISPESYITELSKSAMSFFSKLSNYSIIEGKIDIEDASLYQFIVMNRVSGCFNAVVLFSFNHILADKIVEIIMGQDLNVKELNRCRNDAMAEACNIILGNCFNRDNHSGYVIDIGTPVVIESIRVKSAFRPNDYLSKNIVIENDSFKIIIKLS